jgi:hypothetical protein
MKSKAIKALVAKESGVVLLQKESELGFLAHVFEAVLFMGTILGICTKKLDSVVITKQRLLYILSNKVVYHKKLSVEDTIEYCGIAPSITVTDATGVSKIKLIKLRIKDREHQLIRDRLKLFKNQYKQ